jgi:tetratricopeptide (TPR) repeat protein
MQCISPRSPMNHSRLDTQRYGTLAFRLLAISLVMIATAACGRGQSNEPVLPVQDADVPRIVVLPFENLGTADDAFFAAGLTQEITARLASVNGLRVVSPTGGEPDETADSIGRKLGADYVFGATVLWEREAAEGEQLVVETRLSRVSDGGLVWSDTIVRPLAEVFSVQTQISRTIVEYLSVSLDDVERAALERRSTDNLEAYQAYLRGLVYSSSFEFKELQLAEEYFNRSVTADPNFAVAHAELSENHSLIFHFRYDRAPQRLASSIATAHRALEIDPNLPEGHRALGLYYYWCQRNFEQALGEFSMAAAGRPNDPQIIASIGYVLRRQGRWQEALDALQRVAEINPQSDVNVLDIASTSARMRLWTVGIEHSRRAIALDPDAIHPYVFYARILRARDGAVEDAREVLNQMPDKDPADQAIYWYEQAMYERDFDGAVEAISVVGDLKSEPIGEEFYTGSLAECECRILDGTGGPNSSACANAREILEHKREISPGDPAVYSALGWAYALIGEKEAAIEAGERAVEMLPVTADAMAGHSFLVRLAKIYAWVDEPYRAVKTIEKALRTPGWISVATLNLNPDWDPIREDPRFQELLRIHSSAD